MPFRMKRFLPVALLALVSVNSLFAQPGKPSPVSMDDTSYLEYYLPFKNVKYDPGILSPKHLLLFYFLI